MRSSLYGLLLLSTSGLVAAGEADPGAWLTSLEDATLRASQTNRLILVDLYADWCHWCKVLEAEVFSSPPFVEFASDFVLLRVDTEDGAEGSRLQARFRIGTLPTTLVLDHRLAKVGEIQGFAPTARYIQRIASEIAVYRELESGYERFGESSDAGVLMVLAEEFYARQDGQRSARLYRRLLSLNTLSSEQELLIRYQLADSLRLAKEFQPAVDELEIARQTAARTGDSEALERVDMLAAEIAIDRGDCSQARLSLETFLERYPASSLRNYARRTLSMVRSAGSACS